MVGTQHVGSEMIINKCWKIWNIFQFYVYNVGTLIFINSIPTFRWFFQVYDSNLIILNIMFEKKGGQFVFARGLSTV